MEMSAKFSRTSNLIALLLILAAHVDARSLRPIDTGIAEDHLVRLSTTAARDLLFSRLEKAEFTKYRSGAIKRLAGINKLGVQDKVIAQRLVAFIEKHSQQSKLTDLDAGTLTDALRTLGMVATQSELEYLMSWTNPSDKLKRIRRPSVNGTPSEMMKRQFFIDAAMGLGFSGSPVAYEHLLTLQQSPPDLGRSVASSLNLAVSINQKVREKGLEAVFAESENQ